MHATRHSLLHLCLATQWSCGASTPNLPTAGDYPASGTTAEPGTTEPAPESGGFPMSCAEDECAGCCDEDEACIEQLDDSSCARPTETCRDCTTSDLTCADDAICVNPMQNDEGRVDDRDLHIQTRDDALRTREDLLMRIFGAPELPTVPIAAMSSGVPDPFEVAGVDVTVERLEVDLPGGTTTPFWVLTPAAPSGALVLVHQGHWHTLKEGRLATVAEASLSAGATVVGLTMPLFGESTGPVPTHDDLIARFPSDLPGHGVQVFLAPVVAAIDHVVEAQDISRIAMVGISGGGWTTMLYSALDPRIDLSIPIAGGEPLYQRTDFDWGDREQYDNHLYEVAGTLDLHLLAALEPGRLVLPVLHRYDTCCFAGTGYQEWEPALRTRIDELDGGDFQVFLDESFRGHEVSPHALDAWVTPALSGDQVRYFDDTLPGYATFQIDGDWARDASSGFGNDAARGQSGSATWTIPLPEGAWTAALSWAPAAELSGAVPVTVTLNDERQSMTVDQRSPPGSDRSANADWEVLAAGTAPPDSVLTVTLEVPPGEEVRADALRVEARWWE